MLYTYYSNRQENLADQLAEIVRKPLASPLDEEVIVVQSNGMARWLSLHLAERLGVAAHIRFPFPGAFIWEIYQLVLGDVPDVSPFDPAVLTWRLLDLFAEIEHSEHFAPLHAYLNSGDAVQRYELAWRLADNYDQYLVYRPDWIARWESGQDDYWQAELWRRLVAHGGQHRLHVRKRFFDTLDRQTAAKMAFPQRVSLFGMSALPPVYLEILAHLAQFIDIHLFVNNPSQVYWGDIVAERDIARLGVDTDPEALYLEVGNSLLASLGKQGRDFIDMIQTYSAQDAEGYEEPKGDTLLAMLQSDVLNLRDRGKNSVRAAAVAARDRSLQVHACHSPMREVEVLYDQLLALFHSHPDLRPADVVVMTPDIESYGPVIEAVFATAEGDRYIPFSIADRGLRAESSVVDAFFALLDLPQSRYDANQVLALLEVEAVQRRYCINRDDLVLIYRWVRETGIRWGIDPDNRGELGLPATEEHTWRAGLQRLLLGYALPADNQRLYQGILPYDQVEGNKARVLGRLLSFTDAAFQLRSELAGEHSLEVWNDLLRNMLERFFQATEIEEEQMQLIRTALETLAGDAERAGYRGTLPLEVIRAALRRLLDAPESSGRFISGGVTFCAMLPMRSIPFQVVCLIGMNHDSYPRPNRPLGFDLIARHFRRGDRSRRLDDRYLFLEALLSARRCLYISYIGNNIRDNSLIPPSVLVSELLDAVRRGYYPKKDRHAGIEAKIHIRHPLQAFSRHYFNKSGKLFSYSEELCEASRIAGRGEAQPGNFISTGLPPPEPIWRTLELEQLIRFFANPSRFLLRERLGIRLEEQQGLLETREPFTLDALGAYPLRETLLKLRLEKATLNDTLALMRADGRLPHGQVGESVFEREREDVERFAGRLARALPDNKLDPLPLDLTLEGVRLRGRLTDIGRQGIVRYRLARIRSQDYFELWIRHLALNFLAPAGVTPVSRWLGRDRELELQPVADPLPLLRTLLDVYWQGLSKPLPWFPRSAFVFIDTARNPKARSIPLDAARNIWQGSDYYTGECEDPYFQLAFRENPLDQSFIELAETLFLPLFEHLVEAQD